MANTGGGNGKLFDPQPLPADGYTSNDGKITRYENCNAMLEFNGEILPQFAIEAPMTMQHLLFDKINIPFAALGYEIAFEQA